MSGRVTTRVGIRLWVCRCRRYETTRLDALSLGLGTIYTPGRAAGFEGPARWAVTRAGAFVNPVLVQRREGD